jgi:hypothetical protein
MIMFMQERNEPMMVVEAQPTARCGSPAPLGDGQRLGRRARLAAAAGTLDP